MPCFQDMKGAIDRIISNTSQIEYEDFVRDNKTQDAVMRNIEILGEASKLLSDEIKKISGNSLEGNCRHKRQIDS